MISVYPLLIMPPTTREILPEFYNTNVIEKDYNNITCMSGTVLVLFYLLTQEQLLALPKLPLT